MKIRNLIFLPILLASCSTSADRYKLNIVAPAGAPAVAFYNFANYSNFETTSNPQTGIIPNFQNDRYDVIVGPTQGGLTQIIKQKGKYKIAATITFGNFYLISTGRDVDRILNKGDKVLIFQENDVPGKLFNYVYGDLELDTFAVSSVQDTKSVIENGGKLVDETTIDFDYIYTSEPVLTATKKEIYKNVQKDFYDKTGGKLIPQASIFIRNGVNKNDVDEFLEKIKKDIEDGINNPQLIFDKISLVGSPEAQVGMFGTNATLAKQICEYNGFSLSFKRAIDIKNDIQSYVDLFPQLNLGTLDEEIFYK